jgi:hypothetical protein
MNTMDRANHQEKGDANRPSRAGTRSQRSNDAAGLCRITTTHASCIEGAQKVV